MLVLTPAYGRDYKSMKTVNDDWEANKDFSIATIGYPSYINKQDADREGLSFYASRLIKDSDAEQGGEKAQRHSHSLGKTVSLALSVERFGLSGSWYSCQWSGLGCRGRGVVVGGVVWVVGAVV